MADFNTLRKNFKGDIITPSDPDYEEAISRWALNATRHAQVVAFVRNGDDVGHALRYAKSAGLPVAVRGGGGHNTAGCSSAEGGLVIDLSRYLNHATVDPEKKIAYVQGGAVGATVDKEAIKYGLATVCGTVNHVGLGGFITGGGYGWLSGEHGLAMDNVIQATVVTADGSSLVASETENSDLFFGIRGGGSNFGVVVEFHLQLHPQRATVFCGPLLFTRDKVEAVAQAVDRWFSRAGPKEVLQTVMARGPDRQMYLVTMLFFNGPEEEGRTIWKDLFDLKPVMDGAKEVPYDVSNSLNNENAKSGGYAWMHGVIQDTPLNSLSLEIFDRVAEMSESGQFNPLMITEFIPHDKINSIPPEKTPYRRDLPGNAVASVHWHTDGPGLLEEAKRFAAELAGMVKTTGVPYGNYSPDCDAVATAGPGPLNRVNELFLDHYPKLQRIKKKYDPEMVFNRWFVITPA